MRILIADDDPVFRTLVKDLLAEWGYDTVSACDGVEAWRALEAEDAPELLVLDWMMPGLDGFDLCRKVRADAAKERVYIILMTGGRKKEEIIRVLVAGADDYLIKPFEPVDLKIRLRAAQRILDLRREVAQLRAAAAAA